MGEPGGRTVTVVACTQSGRVLGALPPVHLESPWYPGTQDLVDAVLSRFGVEVTVLRLLDADRPPAPEGGGDVVQLAQVAPADADRLADVLGPVPPLPAHALAEQPLRQAFARPGGPRADLAWADGALARRGTPRTGRATQVRTWNLSSIWRLPTAEGAAWLKSVPPFFAHEGRVLALTHEAAASAGRGPAPLPPLLAHDGGRVLLGEVAGEDLYRAQVGALERMVSLLVGLQSTLAGRVDELVGAGAFDWRPDNFGAMAADVVDRTSPVLDAGARHALARLLDDLPRRWTAIAACGIPDTLVHGDFHPGNVRGTAAPGTDDRLVILDWGDSGVGHPLLDQAAFLEWVPPEHAGRVAARWAALWRRAVPGCEPERAARLLAPVAALRQAVVYRLFLDRIEPSEHLYHAADPPHWCARAAQLAAGP